MNMCLISVCSIAPSSLIRIHPIPVEKSPCRFDFDAASPGSAAQQQQLTRALESLAGSSQRTEVLLQQLAEGLGDVKSRQSHEHEAWGFVVFCGSSQQGTVLGGCGASLSVASGPYIYYNTTGAPKP
jgi:hypothetical protein